MTEEDLLNKLRDRDSEIARLESDLATVIASRDRYRAAYLAICRAYGIKANGQSEDVDRQIVKRIMEDRAFILDVISIRGRLELAALPVAWLTLLLLLLLFLFSVIVK